MLWPGKTAYFQLRRRCWKLVEEEIEGGNLSVPGNDEIGSSVNRRLARRPRNPEDSTAVACYLGLSNGLILEIRMGCPDFTGDAIDLVMAMKSAILGIVENAIAVPEFFDGRTPMGCVAFTENLLEIAGE
jgi:hypothetical protein